MRIESKLCHISENKAVVQVRGWINDKYVGSALAEGSSVERAEDKAISRLNIRINTTQNEERIKNVLNENIIQKQNQVELPKKENLDIINNKIEPNDWSNELTAIDSEIKRLNWSREDENNFLNSNLGYNHRNKITRYTEILKYLELLKTVDCNSTSDLSNFNIQTMIEESDLLLKDLSWDHKKGRAYLQKEFNVSSRNELDNKQLISFVSKLKSIRDKYLSH